MKLFITVGTTPFNSLVKYLDKHLQLDTNAIFQVGQKGTKPNNFESFTFSTDIDDYYNSADIIISHAGAGSVYRLLELKKRLILVPNLERHDDHQIEIARYMAENNHAIVALEFSEIISSIEQSKSFNPNPFIKDEFFKCEEIMEIIRNS